MTEIDEYAIFTSIIFIEKEYLPLNYSLKCDFVTLFIHKYEK